MPRYRLVAIAWACALLALAGCSSIPLSTMWKMRSFGPDDFAKIQPADMRVKVQVPPGCGLDFKEKPPRLDFTIESGGKTTVGKMVLEKVTEADVTEKAGAFSSRTITHHQYELKFTADSLTQFALLQKLVRTAEKGSTKLDLRVAVNFSDIPAPYAKGFNFTISLLLNPADGYFVFLDNARLNLTETPPSSKPAGTGN